MWTIILLGKLGSVLSECQSLYCNFDEAKHINIKTEKIAKIYEFQPQQRWGRGFSAIKIKVDGSLSLEMEQDDALRIVELAEAITRQNWESTYYYKKVSRKKTSSATRIGDIPHKFHAMVEIRYKAVFSSISTLSCGFQEETVDNNQLENEQKWYDYRGKS